MQTFEVSYHFQMASAADPIFANAFKDPNFGMIFLGFFACGYQLAFVSAHVPAMVTEMCSAVSPTSMLNYLGVSNTSMHSCTILF